MLKYKRQSYNIQNLRLAEYFNYETGIISQKHMEDLTNRWNFYLIETFSEKVKKKNEYSLRVAYLKY